MYAFTGDPLNLGLIGLAQLLPFVLIVLPAGQVADQFDRRLILNLWKVVKTLCALLLLGLLPGFTFGWQH